MQDSVVKRVLSPQVQRGSTGDCSSYRRSGCRGGHRGRKEANIVKAREQMSEVVTVAAHLGKA